MNAVEIFSRMATHMVKGMMTHEQLMNAYLFLGLHGCAACHEYHYIKETESYISLCKYTAEHFDSIIGTNQPINDIPDIIPKSWYASTRDKVSHETRLQAIEEALTEWINWEESAKSLYEESYSLLVTSDLAAAEFVKKLALDAEDEIVYARKELLDKRSTGFDMSYIMEEQDTMFRSFRKKIKIK